MTEKEQQYRDTLGRLVQCIMHYDQTFEDKYRDGDDIIHSFEYREGRMDALGEIIGTRDFIEAKQLLEADDE